MPKHLILCDCLGTQMIDADALGQATGLTCSRIHTALCTREMAAAAKAIEEGDAVIACGQEAARFAELAADLGQPEPLCVDIRDRAGWSEDSGTAPKMAALLAEALLPAPSVKSVDIISDGTCLIIGRGAAALPAAGRLADTLGVTVLLTDDAEPPVTRGYEVVRATLKSATGTLGQFTLRLDGLRQIEPGGRGGFGFGLPRDGAETTCAVILDLSGKPPLFPAHEKRDGYLRADPGDPNAVAVAIFETAQHVGTFEKPLHVAVEPQLCAHSRAGQIGCTRCLDACPTGAILPDGDHVTVDPLICAGCGACSSLCPSGAITYDAPPTAHVLRRMQTMAETFKAAGGVAPRLLVHDQDHGAEMIALAARFGRGLPADVLPLSVEALAGFGHAEMLAALALGCASVDVLVSPKSDLDTIAREHGLASAMGGKDRLRLMDVPEPDALSTALYDAVKEAPETDPVLPLGNRRQVARLAARALMQDASDPVPLPGGAPYGAVLVDKDACTLCLSCASLCPSGALGDNPDKPQLRFQEDACLQCGLCATICPEKAITLEPRFNPADTALAQIVLHEEEPFECIECGRPFGVRSTVEKIMEKLAGKHAMFAEGGAGRLIQMCDDCRIRAQYHSEANPLTGGDRPLPRTTDDYLSKRRDH